MKSLTQPLVALILLMFAGAPFAQDEVAEEEGGGWFSGITEFFSNLFSSDDDEVETADATAETTTGIEWYAGAEAGVAKHEASSLRVARDAKAAYGGGIFANRYGFELGYLDMGNADVKGAPGASVAVDGYRGMVTLNSEAGDSPVRMGIGYYTLDASIGGTSESSSGFTAGVKFEQAITEHLYLSLGSDLFLGGKQLGENSDSIMFTLGVSFHTARSALSAEAEGEGEGVEVTEPAAEEPVEAEPAEEPAPVEEVPAEEPAE